MRLVLEITKAESPNNTFTTTKPQNSEFEISPTLKETSYNLTNNKSHITQHLYITTLPSLFDNAPTLDETCLRNHQG